MTDGALLQRARAGDQNAFRELYDHNVDRVFRVAFRMTGDEELARDCTQDAFVRAFQSLESFRGDSRFSTWIHTIAVSVVLNGLRSDKRRREREVEAERDTPTTSAPSGSDPGLREKLRRAVNALPEIYRTVFLMHDLEGFKHHEIAESLGVAVGTSKARLSRAREALRQALSDVSEEYV